MPAGLGDVKEVIIKPEIFLKLVFNGFQNTTNNKNLISRLDQPQSSLGGQVCCQENVGLLSGNLFDADDDSVSNDGDEPVDVSAQVDLDLKVTLEKNLLKQFLKSFKFVFNVNNR